MLTFLPPSMVMIVTRLEFSKVVLCPVISIADLTDRRRAEFQPGWSHLKSVVGNVCVW
jgi:hypothetical protein